MTNITVVPEIYTLTFKDGSMVTRRTLLAYCPDYQKRYGKRITFKRPVYYRIEQAQSARDSFPQEIKDALQVRKYICSSIVINK